MWSIFILFTLHNAIVKTFFFLEAAMETNTNIVADNHAKTPNFFFLNVRAWVLFAGEEAEGLGEGKGSSVDGIAGFRAGAREVMFQPR